jgi:hypothetical protein
LSKLFQGFIKNKKSENFLTKTFGKYDLFIMSFYFPLRIFFLMAIVPSLVLLFHQISLKFVNDLPYIISYLSDLSTHTLVWNYFHQTPIPNLINKDYLPSHINPSLNLASSSFFQKLEKLYQIKFLQIGRTYRL